MLELARDTDRSLSTNAIADLYQMSAHHLAKVMQQLVRSGMVHSVRGVGGGHRLAREPKDITLFDIVDIFEGVPDSGSQCLLTDPGLACRSKSGCELQGVFDEIGDQVQFTLRSISLKTLLGRGQTSCKRCD